MEKQTKYHCRKKS